MVGNIAHFREINNALRLHGRNVLVVGGTGGIGAAAAMKFAQLGASVTIAGRNKQVGAEMVEKMRHSSPNKADAKFSYLPVDITIMSDVKRFTEEYTHSNSELHTLLVTSGGLNLGPKRDTVEGVEHNFAISYLGRFLVINRLLPLLLKAPEGRAMSVLSAGSHAGTVDLEDVEMKAPGAYSKLKSATVNSICNDAMVEELAVRNQGKNVSFFHMSPGAVSTDIMINNKVPLASVLTPLMRWFATTPEDYAEVVVHIATAPEFGPGHSGSLGSRAQVVGPYEFVKKEGVKEALWKYSAKTSGLLTDN